MLLKLPIGQRKAVASAIAPALPTWTDICSCNICIDLHGRRKCRKIAWSNRGHHIPVGYVGKEREQERKLRLKRLILVPDQPG